MAYVGQEAIEWACKQRCGTHTKKLVLVMLAKYANPQTGFSCWPSVSTLMEIAELSRGSVQRALRALEHDGLIESAPRTGSSTIYRLLVNPARNPDEVSPNVSLEPTHQHPRREDQQHTQPAGNHEPDWMYVPGTYAKVG